MLREDSANPLLRFAAKVQRKLFYHRQWFLHLDRHGNDPLNPDFSSGFDFMPPPDRFWADPFLWFADGRNYVFFEELPFATDKGHISVIEFDDAGRILNCTRVLETPWHLSYPYLFEWQGDLWMLPESGASRRVTLYRCESFPDRWVEAKVLMENVNTADPTLIERDGRWWLFINIEGLDQSIHETLHVFTAPCPLGPFSPHPGNPVRRGAYGVRPAGTPFAHQGELYRPGQDCGRLYGIRTVVNRVQALSPQEYREEAFATVEPGWRADVLRTHTLSVRGSWRAVDAMRWLPRAPLIG